MTTCLIADPFTGEPYTGVRKHAARIFASRTDWKGKKIADLSCGDGVTTYILRTLGADVTPYELVQDFCKLEDKPLYADVQKPLPIESESVDVVILQEVIEHLPNQLFTLQEICRILRPGGELFLTTPSRSSLQAKLGYLVFESEHLRSTPWSLIDGVWGANEKGEKYFGHLWLIGIQQLWTFGLISGFRKMDVHWAGVGRTSALFIPFFYPLIALLSLRALLRDLRHNRDREGYKEEKLAQFRLNLSPRSLLSKYGFYSLYK